MSWFVVCLLLVFIAISPFTDTAMAAQQHRILDSLQRLVIVQSGKRPDTQIVNALNTLSRLYRSVNLRQSIQYAQQALQQAHTLQYREGIALGWQNLGVAYRFMGNIPLALEHYQKALQIREQMGDRKGNANIRNNIGLALWHQGKYEQALTEHLLALKIREEIRDTAGISSSLNNVGIIYEKHQQWEKALHYYSLALAIDTRLEDTEGIFLLMNNIGVIHEKQHRYDSALVIYRRAFQMNKPGALNREFATMVYNLAVVYQNLGASDSALYYFQQSLMLRRKLEDLAGVATCHIALGNYFVHHSHPAEGLRHLFRALYLADSLNLPEIRKNTYLQLSSVMDTLGNFRQALRYYQSYEALKDTLSGREVREKIEQLHLTFETDKKDRELALLRATQETIFWQNNVLITGLLGVILLASAIISLVVVKKRSETQRLLLQQTERQNAEVLTAVLQGYEEASSRIARELHDGAGHLLGLSKLRFSSFVSALDPTNKQILDDYRETLSIFDHAVNEVRAASHQLMPLSLRDYGILPALEFIINLTQKSGDLIIDFQTRGMESPDQYPVRFPAPVELTIYRIVQEIIHNTLKHACATILTIDLSFDGAFLFLITEDNGQGFTPAPQSKGFGLVAIHKRIEAFQGTASVESSPGSGTTWNIQIPVNPKKIEYSS